MTRYDPKAVEGLTRLIDKLKRAYDAHDMEAHRKVCDEISKYIHAYYASVAANVVPFKGKI